MKKMNPPKKYEQYFEKLADGSRKTLKDSNTKLFIRVRREMYLVTVDRGIVQDVRDGIQKCDYLLYDEINAKTHLIELKGEIIKKALEQLELSIENIRTVTDVCYLLEKLKILDAYIVSPERQQIPVGINSLERNLAGKLAKRCSERPKNILQLIKYVKVYPDGEKSEKDRHIICSNRNPLEFE